MAGFANKRLEEIREERMADMTAVDNATFERSTPGVRDHHADGLNRFAADSYGMRCRGASQGRQPG
jgi:hypothetical protein